MGGSAARHGPAAIRVSGEDDLMTSTHRPGREDLARAHEALRAHESRDLFYRAAIALVGLARESARLISRRVGQSRSSSGPGTASTTGTTGTGPRITPASKR